jgi:hypothetical protein
VLDYRSILFGPIYACWGVPAVLTTADGAFFELTAIDMTTGQSGVAGPSELETVRPSALMLQGDLTDAGVDMDSLDDCTLTLNNVTWDITGYRPRPSPNGEADGEVDIFLERPASP